MKFAEITSLCGERVAARARAREARKVSNAGADSVRLAVLENSDGRRAHISRFGVARRRSFDGSLTGHVPCSSRGHWRRSYILVREETLTYFALKNPGSGA